MELAIRDLWPARATYHPGARATLILETRYQPGPSNPSGATITPAHYEIVTRLTWLTTTLAETKTPIAIAPGDGQLEIPLELPATAFRGYGVEVEIRDERQQVLATASTAIDVLDSWAGAPRYGFLADFAPDDATTEERVASLTRYHLNAAQFYDWMWRHYELMPPIEPFVDAMGRTLSLATVRARVAACRERGIAAIGYAAVYGAEPEYADQHPDEVVYDPDGKPYMLGDLFGIMNLKRGGPWNRRIITTMSDAVRNVPFDGLHLDQYGMPMEASFDNDGQPCDFPADFAAFIDDARAAIQQPGREVRAIFNAVSNWPIEQVAPTSQDAVYIEVWPPDTDFAHLQRLIRNAHELAPTKQTILAAYMLPLGDENAEELTQAEAATRLTSAAIWSNGGFHLLLGEQNSALKEAYYVNYAHLRPAFVPVMRGYYDFVVRYMNVLSDRALQPAADIQVTSSSPEYRFSDDAAAGTIWTVARSMPGYTTLSLINLASAQHAHWNDHQTPPTPVAGLRMTLRLSHTARDAVQQVVCASPDAAGGAAVNLAFTAEPIDDTSVAVTFDVPTLHYWNLLVIETGTADDSEQEGHNTHA